MHALSKTDQRLVRIGGISGILSIVCYFSVAVFSFIPDAVALLIAFAFPLLWIIAFMGLYRFLKAENHTASLEIGYLFGIIGAAIACTFLVVQQANFIWHEQALERATTEEASALALAAFRGANRVQAGMDVAFDIFITVSWLLFGINIAWNSRFPRLLGWIGSALAAGLLALNMITFPDAPAEAGLFDLGPFLGLWALVIFIWFTREAYRKEAQEG